MRPARREAHRRLFNRTASLFAALVVATPAAAAGLTVKYRSAQTVYVDGGRAQGLSVGHRLNVVSGAETTAELEVVFVAEQSASCRILSERRAVKAGDVVRQARAGTPSAGPAASPPSPPAPSPPAAAPALVETPSPPAATPTGGAPSRPWARLRGGVSFGYYRVWDETASELDFQQRTGRADLSAWELGGKPYSFTLRASSRQDVRARTLSSFVPKDERDDRLYELSLRHDTQTERVGWEIGRVGVSRFVGIGYLDGALVRLRVARGLQLGGFYGRRADLEGLGFEGSGRKYGGFLRYVPGGAWSTSATDVTLALVREFAADDVSREYLSLESRFGSGSKLMFFERAELDLNRGWRETASGQAYQLSNLSLSASVRLSPSASAALSYDNHRNYRTHLNRSLPEETFDRLLRQGLRATLNVGKAYGASFNLNAGVRLVEQGGQDTWSFGAGARHGNLWSRSLTAGLDAAGYTNAYTAGALISARLGKRMQAGHLLDLSYGGSLYRLRTEGVSRATHWLRLSGRGQLEHGVYLASDLEYGFGDDFKGPRGFFELGWLF
ncbi:MAG: hypothetical protein AB7O37_14430 [Vicinamibacteria bacterium]